MPVIPSEAETIGMAMLQHFDFTLDFPNRRAKFTPLDVNRDQMPVDASGLRVVFRGPDNLVVRRLVPGYPAEKAGFKVGDRILDFHGRKPETLWRYEIDELLSQAGETLQFVIEREGQQMTLPLTLRRPFEYPPKWAPETPSSTRTLQRHPTAVRIDLQTAFCSRNGPFWTSGSRSTQRNAVLSWDSAV